MKKQVLTLAVSSLALAGFVAPAAAQEDVMVIDGQGDSIISGTIEDIGDDSLDLLVGTDSVEVNMEDMNLDDGVADFLAVGDQVKVFGHFEDGDFEANKIVKSESVNTNVEVQINPRSD